MTSSVRGQDEPNLALIGYQSGRDGAILPVRDTGSVTQGKSIMFWCFIPHNKSLIDQACSIKMAGRLASVFFYVFMDLDFVSVPKHAKTNVTNIQQS